MQVPKLCKWCENLTDSGNSSVGTGMEVDPGAALAAEIQPFPVFSTWKLAENARPCRRLRTLHGRPRTCPMAGQVGAVGSWRPVSLGQGLTVPGGPKWGPGTWAGWGNPGGPGRERRCQGCPRGHGNSHLEVLEKRVFCVYIQSNVGACVSTQLPVTNQTSELRLWALRSNDMVGKSPYAAI